MILYTPLSESDIFDQAENTTSSQQFISYQGRTCCVEQGEDGSYEMIQLLSTDPNDFLNEQFSPGNVIS